MASVLGRSPAFRALWASRTVSQIGDGIGRVALVLLVAGRGPSAVALVLLAGTLPRILGPLAGAVADRSDTRRLMRACELASGVSILLIAAARPPLVVVLVLVAVSATAATATSTAGRSAVPALVAPEQIAEATGWLGTALNLEVLLGGAAGGGLVALAGAQGALFVDSATFAAAVVLLSGLPRMSTTRGPRSALWTDTVEGVRYARREPTIRALALGTFVLVAFLSLDNVALVFLIRDTLHASSSAYGVAQTVFGAGMVGGSLALVGLGRRNPVGWLLAGAAAGTVGVVGTGLAPALGLALLAQLVSGVGNAVDVVASDILVQRLSSPPLLGRVFGLMGTCAQLGAALAFAVGGPLLAATSPRTIYLIAGIGSLAALPLLVPALRAGSSSAP